MKRAFVTGGSGFVGSNLIQTLVDQGVEVRGLARSDAAAEAVRLAGAEVVRGDLDSTDAMTTGMQDCDVVFHAAAVVTIWGDPEEFHRINVQGTQNVIDCAKVAGVSCMVHVSTEALLGGGKPIVDADETWPYPDKPVGIYAITKGLAEQRVIAANDDSLRTVAIRPPLIWGKGDTSVLPQIAAAVKSGQWMWFGGGRYLHTTTHIRNVIEGLLLAAEKGRGGEVYFVTDGPHQEFREFMTRALATQGVEDTSRSIPFWLGNLIANVGEWFWVTFKLKGMPPLPRSVMWVMGQKMTIDDSKARRELGYEGKVSFEEGIAEMAEDA